MPILPIILYPVSLFFLAYLTLSGIAQAAPLPAGVQQILQEKNIPADSLAVLIQELDDQSPLLAHNVDAPLNPASVMKLVTTYAALQILGPEYRWNTEFYLDGTLRDGTLFGDLVVKGYGDPYLVEETLLPVLRKLRQKGLKNITGKLVIDNSYFQESEQDPGAFDNKPFRVYNANPSALMTNFQSTRFTLTPNAHAGEIEIDAWPASPGLTIDNEMTYVKGRCRGSHRWPHMWFSRDGDQLIARFKGEYSSQCGQHDIHRAVALPSALFYGAFIPAWKYLGGTIVNGYRVGQLPDNAKPFYVHKSKPLADIIRLINKHSNNVMTKQLLLTIGAQAEGEPGTLEKGRQAIIQWMQSENIDTSGFVIDNGSGLSRDARISVSTLNQLARHQWRSPWMPEMLSSLSILSRDGTGKSRFKNHRLNGQMHIKTGLLDHVRSMAGVFHTASGKRYIVISLQNHQDIHKLTGTRIQDSLLQWLDDNG
jgi:D-alanyl-D-alanine carboxypeptidase/D-alanyl-D-alanine-endopeptidase (penicillin-binding protein 4)